MRAPTYFSEIEKYFNGQKWTNSARILVTPEELASKASSVNQKITRMRSLFQDMENKVNSTNGYWVGEANDEYRGKYRQYKEVIEEMFNRLQEHVTDLNEMSGVYSTTEKEIEEMIEELPVDIIS